MNLANFLQFNYLLSHPDIASQVETLSNNFIRYCGRLSGAKAHRIYFMRFVLCEILNLVNVVGQGRNSIALLKFQ